MGERGPLPKRIEERRRRNAVPGETTVQMDGDVRVPKLAPGQHPVAAAWYRSLKDSGQGHFFEPSDWAAAQYVAAAMTKNLNAETFSGPLFGTVWGAMNDLLTTEQARRRARLQVQRLLEPHDEGDKPSVLDEYRKAIG